VRRANEVLVGAAVLVAFLITVAGSIWLSQARFGRQDRTVEARFRTIGGLTSGDPVLLRGVRIGRVEAVTLGERNWVNVGLRLAAWARLPQRPVALISSTTLFGDWGVQIVSRDDLPDDPAVLGMVDEAARAGAERWPGATLPDIGQLTTQASRIAGDIAILSSRIEDAFDSTSAARLRLAFLDLSRLSRSLATIARAQESTLIRIGGHLDTGTAALARGAVAMERAAQRADSASSREQLQRILANTDSVATDLRSIAGNLRTFSSEATERQASFGRIIAHTDSVLSRIEAGQGTLGRLTRDTTLYHESLSAVRSLRELIADMRANPRRYFSFSVF
jgi:phospholipid/cholesterol/gamma-HCH transport system substrate-binding protein